MLMEQYLKDLISKGHNISIIRPPWFHGGNMPDRQKSFYSMIIKVIFQYLVAAITLDQLLMLTILSKE